MWMGAFDEEILVSERIAEARRQAAAADLLRQVDGPRRSGGVWALLSRLVQRGARRAARDGVNARPAASGGAA